MEPEQANDVLISSYYTYLAGRLPGPDLWGDRLAIDLFGAGELPAEREVDDASNRATNSWSEERIVTRNLGGDLNEDSASGSALQGRLLAAFAHQQLAIGPYSSMTPTKTAEVPVRGFIPRLIRWAHQNPLLAGLLGGGLTLLLAVFVSRNTVQGPGAKPA